MDDSVDDGMDDGNNDNAGDYSDDVNSLNGDVEPPSPDDQAVEAMRGPHRNDHEPSQDIEDAEDVETSQSELSGSEDHGSPHPCSAQCAADMHQIQDNMAELGRVKDELEKERDQLLIELNNLKLQGGTTPRRTERVRHPPVM